MILTNDEIAVENESGHMAESRIPRGVSLEKRRTTFLRFNKSQDFSPFF